MAKRSDFAQKLLDDLRLRKERMAATQGSSSHSNTATASAAFFAGDVSGYTQQLVRGSEGQKYHEYVTLKAMDMHMKSNTGQRSLGFDEASSQQIVPFRKGQSSQPIGEDLSAALGFAFQNGGKFKTVNSSGKTTSVISFLRRIGKRSVDLKKAGKSNSLDICRHQRPSSRQCPAALSHSQVKEVSVGVQKLNQILSSCANGSVSIDKYSIKIGKELLKGAVDLEEALKMLVALQDAPEYEVYPRGKSHIKLVEVDDEGENANDNMVMVSNEKKQADLPRFSFDKPSRKLEKEYLPTSDSQRRSTSFGSGVGTRGEFTEYKKRSDRSQPKTEKGRISNVVAKLMGLDELVETADTNNNKIKESICRPKLGGAVSKKVAPRSVIDSELMKNQSSQGLALQGANKQVVKGNKVSDTKKQGTPDAYLDFFVYAGKPPLMEDLESSEDVKPATGSRKTSDKLVMEQKRTLKGETKQPSSNGELMRKEPRIRCSDISRASIFLGSEGGRGIILPTDKRIADTALTVTENQAGGNKPEYKKQRLQETKHKGNEAVGGNPSKLKLNDERSGSDLKLKTRSTQSASPRNRKNEIGMEKVGALQVIGKKPAHTASAQKQRVNRKLHNKTLVQKGAEHVIRSQSTKTVPRANGWERTGALNIEMKLQENQTSTLKRHTRVERQSQPDSLTSDNSTQNIISGELIDKKGQATISCRDQDPMDDKIISDSLGITPEGCMDMVNYHPISDQKYHKSRKDEAALTNEENYLKQILLKSHLFLYTAEAVFDLNIPVAILKDSSGDNFQYEKNDKLMLDCGYEVMRRKERRLELSIHSHLHPHPHPHNKMVRSLDNLVRQLHRDIENLRYGRWDGIGQWDNSDYLYKMIDGDIQNKDPDVNCMWDMGWTGIIFGFLEKNEIIRDVERQMLDGFIGEVTSDFCLIIQDTGTHGNRANSWESS